MWFCIPFTLATTMGLSALALDLPITLAESGSGTWNLERPAAASSVARMQHWDALLPARQHVGDMQGRAKHNQGVAAPSVDGA